jgi:hypothetical protein
VSVVESLRAADDRLSPDDAPAWAEVLGVVLVVGLATRDGVHAWTALLGGDLLGERVDPHLADHDVTLASPVLGLRGHRLDRVARAGTALLGAGAWHLFDPAGIVATNPVVGAWVAANVAVLCADPALWALHRIMTTPQSDPTDA